MTAHQSVRVDDTTEPAGLWLISHTTRRAGVCIADTPLLRGAWSEQTGPMTTADGLVYHRPGKLVCDLKAQ